VRFPPLEQRFVTGPLNLWGYPSFFSFLFFVSINFYLHPLWFDIMMVNSRSSSWDCFLTGPLNWGTVCRIYILLFIMYDYQTFEMCRKFIFFLFSILAMPGHNRSHHFCASCFHNLILHNVRSKFKLFGNISLANFW